MNKNELKEKIINIFNTKKLCADSCRECEHSKEKKLAHITCYDLKVADAIAEELLEDINKYEKLAYEVRCKLTSITRYIHKHKREYNKRYKELANKATNELLDLVNGGHDD